MGKLTSQKGEKERVVGIKEFEDLKAAEGTRQVSTRPGSRRD